MNKTVNFFGVRRRGGYTEQMAFLKKSWFSDSKTLVNGFAVAKPKIL